MKRILFCLVVMSSFCLAQTVSPTVDTVWYSAGVPSGKLFYAVSHWGVNSSYCPSTAGDTLAPALVSQIVEVTHAGAYTGDTLWVGYQQSPGAVVKYTDKLINKGDVVYRDFGGKYITRILIKSNNATTCYTYVKAY
jgi:hypothetical protein